jgi:hypothetical protein
LEASPQAIRHESTSIMIVQDHCLVLIVQQIWIGPFANQPLNALCAIARCCDYCRHKSTTISSLLCNVDANSSLSCQSNQLWNNASITMKQTAKSECLLQSWRPQQRLPLLVQSKSASVHPDSTVLKRTADDVLANAALFVPINLCAFGRPLHLFSS